MINSQNFSYRFTVIRFVNSETGHLVYYKASDEETFDIMEACRFPSDIDVSCLQILDEYQDIRYALDHINCPEFEWNGFSCHSSSETPVLVAVDLSGIMNTFALPSVIGN